MRTTLGSTLLALFVHELDQASEHFRASAYYRIRDGSSHAASLAADELSLPQNESDTNDMKNHDPSCGATDCISRGARRRWLSALTIICLASVPACDAGEDFPEGDTDRDGAQSDRISNGFDSPHYFWNGVIRLANGCTGTLIGETYMLTAGHCVPRPTVPGGVVNGTWYNFTSGTPGPTVQVGPDVGSPLFTRSTTQYNEAGFDDILLLRLSGPVPGTYATAVPPVTDIPGGGAALTWLQSQDFDMSGFGLVDGGASATERQRAEATVAEFPFTSFGTLQPNLLRAVGEDCATIQPGDSGSPLLWFDFSTNVLRTVGVAQGREGCGGRYVATFGEGGTDSAGNAKPNIGDWFETTIPVDFVIDSEITTGCTGPGGTPTALMWVKNQGLTARSGWVDFFLDEASPPSIGTYSSMYQSSGLLQPGQRKLITFTLPATRGNQSTWADVLLDTTQTHAEDKENNNHADTYVTFPDCSFS